MSQETRIQEPSINPANMNTLAGTFKLVLQKFKQEMNGLMPVRVLAFTRSETGDRVQVVPTIKMIGTNGAKIDRAQVSSVPVLRLGGGGFGISFPINPGDLGWLLAADRDISTFLQNYSDSAPQTTRIGEFSDGWFIPDVMTGFSMDENDTENVVIQKLDGSVKITLADDTITISAPNIVIDSDADLMIIAGNTVEITGNLKVIGDIEATGNITPNVPP